MARQIVSVTRRRIVGAGGVLGVGALAACAPVGQAPAAKMTGPVTVVYTTQVPETQPAGGARLELFNEFNRTNTQQITVDVTDGKAQTTAEKVKALAVAGTPPNLWVGPWDVIGDFYGSGLTIDLETELRTEKDWSKQRGDLFPGVLETSMWAGKLVGMPMFTNQQAFIYNTGLLQQAAVAPPKWGWTWDDFQAVAEKFIRPGIIPLSMAWDDWDHWLGVTGARPISRDGRKITIDTPEMLAAMEFVLGLYNRGIAQLGPDGLAVRETYRLAKNDTVFELQGHYRIPVLRQVNAPAFSVVHVPIRPGKGQVSSVGGGHSLVVFKGVAPEKRYAAALVAKWLNTPHGQVLQALRGIHLPVSKSAMESREFQEPLRTDPQFKAFVDLAPYNWRWVPTPSLGQIDQAIQRNVDTILRREMGIKPALIKAQQEAQVLLDQDIKLMQ